MNETMKVLMRILQAALADNLKKFPTPQDFVSYIEIKVRNSEKLNIGEELVLAYLADDAAAENAELASIANTTMKN